MDGDAKLYYRRELMSLLGGVLSTTIYLWLISRLFVLGGFVLFTEFLKSN